MMDLVAVMKKSDGHEQGNWNTLETIVIGCFRWSTNGIYQGNKPASWTFRGCALLLAKWNSNSENKMYLSKANVCNDFNYNLPISIKYSYHLQRRHYIGKHCWEVLMSKCLKQWNCLGSCVTFEIFKRIL